MKRQCGHSEPVDGSRLCVTLVIVSTETSVFHFLCSRMPKMIGWMPLTVDLYGHLRENVCLYILNCFVQLSHNTYLSPD